MARRREIDPSFFIHDRLHAAEISSGLPLRLAFAGLWCHADREGRFEWKPVQLKLGILPFDDLDFEKVLDALTDAGFLEHYRVDDREYGVVPTFDRWQRPHPREAQSRIPAPSDGEKVGPRRSKARPRKSKARPRRSKSVGPSSLSSPSRPSDPQDLGTPKGGVRKADLEAFEAIWKLYPKRPNNSKGKARKAFEARLKAGVTAEALATGVVNYAAYVEREGVEPRFVKHAATFFGPDEHWLTDYGPVESPKIFPYLNEAGEPDADGDIPNPEFWRMVGGAA